MVASKRTGLSGHDPAKLRQREEVFALTFATTGDRKLSLEKAGYSRGSGWRQLAQKILIRPRVNARIAELRREIADKETTLCAVKREEVLAELWDNVQRAKAAIPVLDSHGQPTGVWRCDLNAANRALELYGKSMALFADKTITENLDNSLDGKTDEEVRALVDSLILDLGPTRIRAAMDRHFAANEKPREGEVAAAQETPAAQAAPVPPGRVH